MLANSYSSQGTYAGAATLAFQAHTSVGGNMLQQGNVAYTQVRQGSAAEVFIINADGTQPKDLSNNPAADLKPAWIRIAKRP